MVSEDNGDPSLDKMKGFDDHKHIFQSVSITAGAAFAVLVGFLGSVWDNSAAAAITLDALISVLVSLAPSALVIFYVWQNGGSFNLLKKRGKILNGLLPLFSLATFGYLAYALILWLYRLSAIVKLPLP